MEGHDEILFGIISIAIFALWSLYNSDRRPLIMLLVGLSLISLSFELHSIEFLYGSKRWLLIKNMEAVTLFTGLSLLLGSLINIKLW
jgi:hypothetical protein